MFSLRTFVKLPRPSRVCISKKATKYLKKDVTSQKQRVPFGHYDGGVGRCAQAKNWGWI